MNRQSMKGIQKIEGWGGLYGRGRVKESLHDKWFVFGLDWGREKESGDLSKYKIGESYIIIV